MSSRLHKLQIQGVRSFAPDCKQVIEFHTPLTLIVGYNGSGKTTIIECLKYATTGDLPPNSKGGAFIHDPKLCGEKEVLAQVKLQFFGTAGARMTLTRSMQLLVKKNTRQMKTLEGNMTIDRNGEKTSISSRVAELDAMMPQYLGVSKAVLDNVIFCHQDESLWPLSEPGTLKKKFDEIFEALKYTKAIDNIKVIRKKQNEELGKLRITEQHAKDDKDKGYRAEKRMQALKTEIEEILRPKVDDLRGKIEDAIQKSKESWDNYNQFMRIVNELEAKRSEARMKQESIDSLAKYLQKMDDSDDELRAMLDKYEERLGLYQEDLQTQIKHYNEIESQIQQGRRTMGDKQAQHGRFQAEQDHHETQTKHRQDLVKKTARHHGVRGFENDLDDANVRLFIDRINKMANDQNAALQQARRETQQELQNAQRALNVLNENKSALNQSKENAKSQLASNDRKIAERQKALDRITIDEGSKATLQSSIDDLQLQSSRSKTEFREAVWDKQLQSVDQELQSFEQSNEKLNEELNRASKNMRDAAELDYFKKHLKDSEHSLETMRAAHDEKIKKMLGPDWQVKDLAGRFETTTRLKIAKVHEAESQRDSTNKELEQVGFKLGTLRDDLQKKRKELQRSKEKVTGVLESNDPEAYPEEIATLEHNRDFYKQDVDSFQARKSYFEDSLKTAKDNDCCRLCTRLFQSKHDLSEFTKKLEKYLSDEGQKQAMEDLKNTETELQELKSVNASFDIWKRMSKEEIPAIEAEQKRLEPDRERLLRQVEEEDNSVNALEATRRDAEGLSKTVQTILKYNNDVESAKRQLQEIASRQSNSGVSRGIDEIQDEMKSILEKSKHAKSKSVRLLADRDRAQGHISNFERQLVEAKSKLAETTHQLREKEGIVEQIEELSTTNEDQRRSLKQFDLDLLGLSPQISQAQAKYDDVNSVGEHKQQELQAKVSDLGSSVNQLELVDREIRPFLDKGGPQQLARSKREMERTQEEIERSEKEKKQLTTEIKKLQEQESNHAETRRCIEENLRYRRDSRGLETIRVEIVQLEEHNAEADRVRYQREGQKWDLERDKLTAERTGLVGESKAKDSEFARLYSDWETEYKDAKKSYREAHIRVEVHKAASEDLGRYGGALDKAIMRFHSIKMEEINRIIGELWRSTYQGSDVDNILIRSDNENVKGNKSYNYRVCMVKQEAEMDMRGRCSAGQKVLASIIIRLALAECFGVHSGVIALDEPTTNLDKDNIRSLAESLHQIIKDRSKQKNLQLIVITHDEDFLRYMHCSDFCDSYYQVRRGDRQRSEIWKQAISKVM